VINRWLLKICFQVTFLKILFECVQTLGKPRTKGARAIAIKKSAKNRVVKWKDKRTKEKQFTNKDLNKKG